MRRLISREFFENGSSHASSHRYLQRFRGGLVFEAHRLAFLQVVRAAFDVGSGAVKVTVAEVDLHLCVNGHVNKILFEKKAYPLPRRARV